MTAKMPPVPPQNRSPKGTGSDQRPPGDTRADVRAEADNLRERGHTANTKQNTTHQGYQQDR